MKVSHDMRLPRREFLKTTGLLTGALAVGSPLALIAPGRAWAVDLHALTSAQGATLMAVARTIAPHDGLDESAYAAVIKAVDAAAAGDPALLETLRTGVQRLGPGFAKAPEATRVSALKKIEHSKFFQTLHQQTLGVLYTTPAAYAYFGYQGEAFSKGGYLYRGFNDLHWLPEVPLRDSGPVPGESHS